MKTDFLIRIELLNGTEYDYAKLDNIMIAGSYGNQVFGDDGRKYRLPTGQYHTFDQGELTAEDVRRLVSVRLNQYGYGGRYYLIVSRTVDFAFYCKLV